MWTEIVTMSTMTLDTLRADLLGCGPSTSWQGVSGLEGVPPGTLYSPAAHCKEPVMPLASAAALEEKGAWMCPHRLLV